MQTTSRSTLDGQTFIFYGFSFQKHPVRKGYFVQVSIYKNQETGGLVVCTSEGKGKGGVNQAKLGLGQEVEGKLIAPFAQRQLENTIDGKIDYQEFKQAIEADSKNWHWAEGD